MIFENGRFEQDVKAAEKVGIIIAGEKIELSSDNSILFIFRYGTGEFDHLLIKTADNRYIYYFPSEALLSAIPSNIPVIYSDKPDDTTLDCYCACQDPDTELEKLGKDLI